MRYGQVILQNLLNMLPPNKQKLLNYLSFALMLIAINSHGNSFELGSTFFWWVIQVATLFMFYKFWKNSDKNEAYNSIKVLIIYSIFSVFRGLGIAETYWDWKYLFSNTLTIIIPLAAFVSFDPLNFQFLIKRFVFFAAPLFLIFQFYFGKDEYGFYLAPFVFLLLFLPIIPNKWKFACIAIAIFVIVSDLGARSNVIKFTIPFVFSLIYFIKFFITIRILNFIRWVLLLIPVLFFYLGVSGNFNVFNPTGDSRMELVDKKRDNQGQLVEDNLLSDTRTFLYLEVLQTASKYDSWILGRSPARGNLSDHFGDLDMNNRNERNANEVGILNYFTWLGIVGIVLLFLVYFNASKLAVLESNNLFARIMGLFVAFRWTYSWVEEINLFHIQYVYLWLMIGLCFSEKFRKMTDKEFKIWVNNIF